MNTKIAQSLQESLKAHKEFVTQVEHFINTQVGAYKNYPYNQVVYYPKFFLTIATGEAGEGLKGIVIGNMKHHISCRNIPETFKDITASMLCRYAVNGHGERPIHEHISEYMPKYLAYLKKETESIERLIEALNCTPYKDATNA